MLTGGAGRKKMLLENFERLRWGEGEDNSKSREKMKAVMRLAIQNLPPRQRQLLQMHLGGMKNKEIAQHLHLAPSTVSRQIKSAKRKLAKTLRPLQDIGLF